jgi:hypothetical protein
MPEATSLIGTTSKPSSDTAPAQSAHSLTFPRAHAQFLVTCQPQPLINWKGTRTGSSLCLVCIPTIYRSPLLKCSAIQSIESLPFAEVGSESRGITFSAPALLARHDRRRTVQLWRSGWSFTGNLQWN